MIYISSDHRGLELKKYLVESLVSVGLGIVDLGPKDSDPEDDYPDFAKLVAEKIQEDFENMGVLICANGVGISIAANKLDGIRAALSWNPKHAASSRNDDGTNVLVLPADYITKEEALEILHTWLSTNFSGEDRHIRRIQKIAELEEI
ncbi:MAG TPA: RpiB/LacA/LacB family sugar-phosphate isomerase [Patescibacteria group bacterium]|nr:RpiB/LacA/LacB family sugar-phosphate isomerase [bacterium]HRY56817.1 RpiB/LacA/LacB family sugar-phosphate isomerase [Patescibacteria group bacterium]